MVLYGTEMAIRELILPQNNCAEMGPGGRVPAELETPGAVGAGRPAARLTARASCEQSDRVLGTDRDTPGCPQCRGRLPPVFCDSDTVLRPTDGRRAHKGRPGRE